MTGSPVDSLIPASDRRSSCFIDCTRARLCLLIRVCFEQLRNLSQHGVEFLLLHAVIAVIGFSGEITMEFIQVVQCHHDWFINWCFFDEPFAGFIKAHDVRGDQTAF